MKFIEEKGKTVEEALKKALESSGVKLEDAVYEVVNDGSRGGPAVVRLYTEIEELPIIEKTITELFEKMKTKVELEIHPERGRYYINIKTKGIDSILIGKGGKTLEDIEHLIGQIISKKAPGTKVEVDVAGYKKRRYQFLINKALAIANRVKETGYEMRLDPLPPRETNIVLRSLKKEKDISTYIVQRGNQKVIVIAPKAPR